MDYPTPIVSREWLHAHLDDENVQVVDCRFALMDPTLGIRQYQSGHIPGAVHLDLNRDLSSAVHIHGGRHPLPNIDQLAHTLGQYGIQSAVDRREDNEKDSNEGTQKVKGPTFVVAYDDSRFAFAARLWWLLRYMGHEQVAILDGGFQGWQSAEYPVAQEEPTPEPATFVPAVRSHWIVDINHVKQRKDRADVLLVDSRQGDRYRGEREPIDPVAGHIPGAVNLFWQEVTTEDGYVQSGDRLRQRWQQLIEEGVEVSAASTETLGMTGEQKGAIAHGNSSPVTDVEEIMVYCGSGVTACVNLLSLELIGWPQGRLYAGSWSDWCSYW